MQSPKGSVRSFVSLGPFTGFDPSIHTFSNYSGLESKASEKPRTVFDIHEPEIHYFLGGTDTIYSICFILSQKMVKSKHLLIKRSIQHVVQNSRWSFSYNNIRCFESIYHHFESFVLPSFSPYNIFEYTI